MTSRLYVVECESGHLWLTRGSSIDAALNKWSAEMERGNAGLALHIRRISDRSEATYLRDMGQADA
jgi:hypothetical protein